MPRMRGEVWKYFDSKEPSGKKGPKSKVACTYCSKMYQIANATRMENHLLLCKECPADIKSELKRPIQYVTEELNWSEMDEGEQEVENEVEGSDEEENPIRKRSRVVKEEPTEVEVPVVHRRTREVSEGPRAASPLSDDDLPALHVDAALARALYASAAPLSLLQSHYWRQALAGAGVHAPRTDALRGDLLDAEYARLQARAQQQIDDAPALALLAESWRIDCGKINIVIMTPEPVFYKSIRCAENAEERMGDEILKVIAEIGGRKFYAVVTDCGMEDLWSLITSKYPHIACVECVSHALNLLCAEIMNISVIKKTVQNATDILNFIKTNSSVLSEFEKLQIETYGSDKRILKLPSKTKWNSGIWVLSFFKASRDILESLARRSNKALNKSVRDLIQNQQLWTSVDGVLEAMAPLSEALTHAGSAHAALSEPAAYLTRVSQALKSLARPDSCFTYEERTCLAAAVERRVRDLKPIQLAANLLDPRYKGAHVASRIPIATEYITELALRLFDGDEEKVSEVLVSLAAFRTGTGYFGLSQSIWRPVNSLAPAVWWQSFAPRQAAATIATRLLSVPPAAPMPRAADAFESVPADSTLSMQRLDKLMYVRHNLRLTDKTEEPDDDELKQVDIHSIFPADPAAVSLENYSVIVVNNPLGNL